jgi:hypothetical protein
MGKAIWCFIVVAVMSAAAALSASYAIGERVSYQTCNPSWRSGPWQYAYDPTWLPVAITAFLVFFAILLAWSWRRDGLATNAIRLFFFADIAAVSLPSYRPDSSL